MVLKSTDILLNETKNCCRLADERITTCKPSEGERLCSNNAEQLKLGVKEGKASFFLAKRVKSVVGLHGHTRG